MTAQRHLKEAIEYVDRLDVLRVFKRNVAAYGGPVRLACGSYAMEVSKACRDELMAMIAVEERMILNTLEIMGVELEQEREG